MKHNEICVINAQRKRKKERKKKSSFDLCSFINLKFLINGISSVTAVALMEI